MDGEVETRAREGLAAAIAEYEADAGPITDEDIVAAKARTAWKPTARGTDLAGYSEPPSSRATES
ncbi:MAG: hypothetical protein ACR2FG_10460 [Marmoricola sp.]